MTRPRVCIGIPQPEMTNHWFQDCLWNLVCSSIQEMDIIRHNAVGSVIAYNRNRLVDMAKKDGATHLLQIDADSTFPPHALATLLKHDLPIVGATTCKRAGNDRRPMCDPLDPRVKPTTDKPLISCRLIGMNFMLTKMEVFEKLRAPYFASPPRWMLTETTHAPDGTPLPELIAEDEYFCERARQSGYEVMCDMNLSLSMGHIGSTIFHITPPNAKDDFKIITGE